MTIGRSISGLILGAVLVLAFFVSAPDAKAQAAVAVAADVPAEYHQIEQRTKWWEDAIRWGQQVKKWIDDVEYYDYVISEQIGKAGDVVEFINKLSGPFNFRAQFMSESYNQFLRLKDEVNKLKDWNISFHLQTDFVSQRSPNRNPTLEDLIARHKIIEDAFDVANQVHLGASEKLSDALNRSASPKAMKMAAKGKLPQGKVQAMILQTQFAASQAAVGSYEVQSKLANYIVSKDRFATADKVDAGIKSNAIGGHSAKEGLGSAQAGQLSVAGASALIYAGAEPADTSAPALDGSEPFVVPNSAGKLGSISAVSGGAK